MNRCTRSGRQLKAVRSGTLEAVSLGMLRSGPRTHFLPFMQQTQSLSFVTTRDWEGHGRMDLVHDALGKVVNKGDTSDPIVYWVAFGAGGDKEAHDLAETVADVGTGDLTPHVVNARGKASTTWGAIKAQH